MSGVSSTHKAKRRGGSKRPTSTVIHPPLTAPSKMRRRKESCHPSVSPLIQPDRVYSEDAWTFSDSLTDRTPPAQVIAQAQHAAQAARSKFLARYGRPGQQTIVCLDVSEPGKIYAKPYDGSDWKGGLGIDDTKSEDHRKLVNYPLALRQLLTPKPPQSIGQTVYHGLVEQMTSQQVATLHALSKLRYDPTEPVAMSIHGPLAIFEWVLN